MLQEFWSYFMATGNIDTYLHFKAYEEEHYHLSENSSESTHEVG